MNCAGLGSKTRQIEQPGLGICRWRPAVLFLQTGLGCSRMLNRMFGTHEPGVLRAGVPSPGGSERWVAPVIGHLTNPSGYVKTYSGVGYAIGSGLNPGSRPTTRQTV